MAQHITAQHSTAQHSTAQHSTAQHSMGQGRVAAADAFRGNLEAHRARSAESVMSVMSIASVSADALLPTDEGTVGICSSPRLMARPAMLALMNANQSGPTNQKPTGPPDLERTVRRSVELEQAVWAILRPESYQVFDDSDRIAASFNACEVAIQHGQALRALMSEGFHTTAASVMRLQFEVLVRAMWLLYAADEVEIAKIHAPLTQEAEHAASKLPMVSAMIKALDGRAPPPAFQMVDQFKTTMLGALNSFVHGGIHPLKRHQTGYPEQIMDQILRSSNGLFTMTAMMLAILSGDESVSRPMRTIQPAFADCLPDLLRH
ncbi:hypothetical protein Bpro_1920 [Polaromonas sp. JS666]|nr:hypothetical protein Bpro_1920 [Polaromonas sp. JS666]